MRTTVQGDEYDTDFKLEDSADGTCKVSGKSRSVAPGGDDTRRHFTYCNVFTGFEIPGVGTTPVA